jgi:ADP-ribose pyrophosphatase YjhB (NUDIX family)
VTDQPGRDVDGWLADLRERHGDLAVHEERIEVGREKYDAVRADAERSALGGARVRLAREGELLLVSNRDEHGWDVPGGALEPGETLRETARREVREETGLGRELGEALAVNRFAFVPAEGDDPLVEGLWVYYEGEVASGTLDRQDAEIEDAGWFDESPAELDPYAEPRVVDYLEGDG